MTRLEPAILISRDRIDRDYLGRALRAIRADSAVKT